MDASDVEKLLERALSGGRPQKAFREQLLRDSTAALPQSSAIRAVWRTTALSAAAVLIVAISFLCGRASVSAPIVEPAPPVRRVAGRADTVPVPGELVAWLEAARFFKQLGMEEREARAYAQASRLVPDERFMAREGVGPVFAVDLDHRSGTDSDRAVVSPAAKRSQAEKGVGIEPFVKKVNQIMAQSFGG